jgi:hypothetical protein
LAVLVPEEQLRPATVALGELRLLLQALNQLQLYLQQAAPAATLLPMWVEVEVLALMAI